MVFSSTQFIFLFLPLLLLCYAVFPVRNLVLCVFSLLFYAWGEGVYILLLITVVAINYLVGNRISKHANSSLWLFIGVALNILVLVYFKYLSFLINDIFSMERTVDIRLPIGVSFFIFQSISYLVDIHRKIASPARNLLDLGLYISLFPQLIAGPIVRYNTIAQAIKSRATSVNDLCIGLSLFSFGLAQKVLLADTVSLPVDQIYALPAAQLGFSLAWLGTFLFALQILFDFAGYSLMAIGLGRLFAFKFPANFDYPYASRSITEFWRKWHISLSTWFRDYLYIPLGGNRKGNIRTMLNLFTVFILCGLWHGAAWTFVLWGLYHGLLLSLERMGIKNLLSKLPSFISNLYVWLAVMVGWVLFRSENIDQAKSMLTAMFSFSNDNQLMNVSFYLNAQVVCTIIAGLVFSYPLSKLRYQNYEDWVSTYPFLIAGITSILFIVSSMFILAGGHSPFLYFRF